MRVEKPAVDKVWTLSTPRLAGQTRDERAVWFGENSYPRKIIEENSPSSCRHHNL
jgi:hypothetical protein